MKAKFYSSKSSIKKKYKPKGIIALYYYYKFLLGFHKKNNIEYKLTPEMQKEVKKMEFYSEQIRFMCKYKLETTDAVDELKNQKLREKQLILNKRISYIITETSATMRKIKMLLLKILFLLQICLRR